MPCTRFRCFCPDGVVDICHSASEKTKKSKVACEEPKICKMPKTKKSKLICVNTVVTDHSSIPELVANVSPLKKQRRTKIFNEDSCTSIVDSQFIDVCKFPEIPVNDIPIMDVSITADVDSVNKKYLVEGVHSSDKIVDLPFHKFGQLLALKSSINFITEKLVPSYRKLYITCMNEIIVNPSNPMLWKKLFLLPKIVLGDDDKAVIKARIQLISDDCWDFTISDLLAKPSSIFESRSNVNLTYIGNLVERGNLSKAMGRLCQDNSLSMTPDVAFQKLLDKFPITQFPNEKKINVSTDIQVIPVDVPTLNKVIRKMKNAIAPGLDGLRYEHLKQLIGKANEQLPDEYTFSDNLAQVCTLILNSKLPVEVAHFLSDNKLIALGKSNFDVRPIGIGSTLRKIVSTIVFRRIYSTVRDTFGKTQYAMRSRACESIIHHLNGAIDNHENWITYCIDAKNAFNSANRNVALSHIMEKFPEVVPFINDMYAEANKGWFLGKSNGIDFIENTNGFHQGDVLAPWLYCLSLQPLLNEINDVIHREFSDYEFIDDINILYYLDDGTLHLPAFILFRVIDLLQTLGPNYGYYIKHEKDEVLIGVQENDLEVQEIRDTLVNVFCIDPSVIHIHPENGGKSLDFGLKVLGSFIGEDEYIKASLVDKLTQLQDITNKLMTLDNLAYRYILFRDCFVHKVNYLYRCINPRLTADFVKDFEALKKLCISSFFNTSGSLTDEITDALYSVLNLPTDLGGLGFHSSFLESPAAYLTSLAAFGKEFYPNTMMISSFDLLSFFFPESSSAEDAWSQLKGMKFDNTLGTVQHQLVRIKEEEIVQIIRNSLNPTQVKWYANFKDKDLNTFLKVKPSYTSNRLSNLHFATYLRYRFSLKMENFVMGLKCSCKGFSVELDPFGHHLATNCPVGNHRFFTHDSIVHELFRIMQYCGHHVVLEPRGVFHVADGNNDKRPDLRVLDPVSFNSTSLLIDVSVTNPLSGISNVNTSRVGEAADIAYAKKMSKYGKSAQDSKLSFLPFIYESTGFLHPEAKRFIQLIAKKASAYKKIDSGTLYSYFLKRLSLALVNGVANSLSGRLHNILSHSNCRAFDPAFSTGVIINS